MHHILSVAAYRQDTGANQQLKLVKQRWLGGRRGGRKRAKIRQKYSYDCCTLGTTQLILTQIRTITVSGRMGPGQDHKLYSVLCQL
eukprot:4805342-Pleurochrysis_carterae.AAC.1